MGSPMDRSPRVAKILSWYAAQIAAQLGAHVIKVKLPTDHIEQEATRKVYEKTGIPLRTAAERMRHVVQCAFDGRRIVIFSGGSAAEDAPFLDEIRAIHAGGGFGSIIGRNAFQRSKEDALRLLGQMVKIYAGKEV